MEKHANGENLWDNAFNRMLKGNFLIKDDRYLNPKFSVKILHREDELNNLILFFRDLVIRPFSKGINHLVIGGSGVGKTTTITYFCSKLIRCAERRGVNLSYNHINCRKEQSWYRVLVKIIKK